MEIRYDNLKEEYLDAIVELDKMCFSIPWSRNLFSDEMNNDKAFYVLAFCENVLVGYGGMTAVLDEADITNIAVHPDFRKRGIASEMLIKLTDYCVRNEISTLMLELRESNANAFNLYKKFGFEVVGARKNYYSDNKEDAILMTKFIK